MYRGTCVSTLFLSLFYTHACVFKQPHGDAHRKIRNINNKNQQTFDLTCCTILHYPYEVVLVYACSQVELRRMFAVFIQEMSVFHKFHSSWLSQSVSSACRVSFSCTERAFTLQQDLPWRSGLFLNIGSSPSREI